MVAVHLLGQLEERLPVVAGRHTVEDYAADATVQVRRHPLAAVALAVAVGTLVGGLIGFAVGRGDRRSAEPGKL